MKSLPPRWHTMPALTPPEHGQGLSRAWPEPLRSLPRASPGHGQNLSGASPEHGQGLSRAWPEPQTGLKSVADASLTLDVDECLRKSDQIAVSDLHLLIKFCVKNHMQITTEICDFKLLLLTTRSPSGEHPKSQASNLLLNAASSPQFCLTHASLMPSVRCTKL